MASDSTSASISVEGLTKLYGSFQALNGIDFSVQPGEIVGFLGPNGAGKSTTMKILTCFMSATQGHARVAGYDVREDSEEVRSRIGYLPENVPLYDEMLVYDYLEFIARVRGVAKDKRREAIKRAATMAGLEAVIARAISELSKGYRQRVGLAQAIIHEPEVVILDEPTTGLDPNQIIEIRDLIKTIGKEKTVLFSTHIMQEVAAVCDRVIIINKGSIVADDTVEALAAKVADGKPGLLVVTPSGALKADRLERMLLKVSGVKAVHFESEEAGERVTRVELSKNAEVVKRALFGLAAEGDLPLKRLGAFEPSLEEIFRTFTGGSTEEGIGPMSSDEEE